MVDDICRDFALLCVIDCEYLGAVGGQSLNARRKAALKRVNGSFKAVAPARDQVDQD